MLFNVNVASTTVDAGWKISLPFARCTGFRSPAVLVHDAAHPASGS